MISNITHRCAAKHRDELPSPHAFLKPKDYNLPHRMEAIVRHSKMACSTSALGHKRTYAVQKAMSALPPIATSIAFSVCPLWAKSGHSGHSFDHLVGAAKQRKRYGKAEGLGGFQIDDQLDLGGLLNWKIGRLLPLDNPAGVYPEQTVRLREIGSVAHEPAGDRKLAVRIYGWHCMAGRQLDQPITLG